MQSGQDNYILQNTKSCMVYKEMFAVASHNIIPISDLLSIIDSYDNTEKILLTAEIIIAEKNHS